MKSGNVINAILILAVATLLGVLALSVRIRPTADRVAVLKTAGMTCGGCSAAVEKTLQAKAGVASVEVDVAGGWVVVGYDSKQVSPEELATAVSGAGYRSSAERSLTVDRFRAMTGRNPGDGQSRKTGCGCGRGK